MLDKLLITIALSHLLVACKDHLAVSAGEGKREPFVHGFDRLSAMPGEELKVSGENLPPDLSVTINQKPVDFPIIP